MWADPFIAQPFEEYQAQIPEVFNLNIPEKLGRVEFEHSAPGPMIVHIQTAHGNYEAQEKIKGLLEYLRDQYGFKTLFLEGTSYELDSSRLDFFGNDKDLSKQTAELLTRKALIKGAELFLMESRDAKAYGIEELESYVSNGEVFREVLTRRQDTGQFLVEMDEQINRLLSVYTAPSFRSFLSEYERFETQRSSLQDWLRTLKNTAKKQLGLDLESPASQFDWPQLTRFFALEFLQEKIDRQKLKNEIPDFLEAVRRVRPEFSEPLEKLLSGSALQAHLPYPQTGQLFEDLARALPADFDYNRYSNAKAVCAFLMIQSELNGPELISEAQKLGESLAGKIAHNETEKKIYGLYRDYLLVQKLFALNLTPEEYEALRARREHVMPESLARLFSSLNGEGRVKDLVFNHLSEISGLFEKSMEFYKGVKDRDEKMLAGVERRLRETGADKAVVITGGFHAGPFRDYFQHQSYSYALIMPSLTTSEGSEAYTTAMLQNQPRLFFTATHEVPFAYSVAAAPSEMGDTYNGALDQLIQTELKVAENSGDFRNLEKANPNGRLFGIRYEAGTKEVTVTASGRTFKVPVSLRMDLNKTRLLQRSELRSDVQALEDPATKDQTLSDLWKTLVGGDDAGRRVAAYRLLSGVFKQVSRKFTAYQHFTEFDRQKTRQLLFHAFFDPDHRIRQDLGYHLYGNLRDAASNDDLMDYLARADSYRPGYLNDRLEFVPWEVPGYDPRLSSAKSYSLATQRYMGKEALLFSISRRIQFSLGNPDQPYFHAKIAEARDDLDAALDQSSLDILENSKFPIVRALHAALFEFVREEMVENNLSLAQLISTERVYPKKSWRMEMIRRVMGASYSPWISRMLELYSSFISDHKSVLGKESIGLSLREIRNLKLAQINTNLYGPVKAVMTGGENQTAYIAARSLEHQSSSGADVIDGLAVLQGYFELMGENGFKFDGSIASVRSGFTALSAFLAEKGTNADADEILRRLQTIREDLNSRYLNLNSLQAEIRQRVLELGAQSDMSKKRQGEKIRKYNSILLHQIRLLLLYLDDRIQLARGESSSLSALIDPVLELVRTRHGEKIKIETRTGSGDAPAISHIRLFSILNNLVSNALHSLPPEIREPVQIEVSADTRQIYFQIKDSGLGMPAEFFEASPSSGIRMFDLRQGKGLGLAEVWATTALAGGEISVESKTGSGTTFTIALPRSEMRAQNADELMNVTLTGFPAQTPGVSPLSRIVVWQPADIRLGSTTEASAGPRSQQQIERDRNVLLYRLYTLILNLPFGFRTKDDEIQAMQRALAMDRKRELEKDIAEILQDISAGDDLRTAVRKAVERVNVSIADLEKRLETATALEREGLNALRTTAVEHTGYLEQLMTPFETEGDLYVPGESEDLKDNRRERALFLHNEWIRIFSLAKLAFRAPWWKRFAFYLGLKLAVFFGRVDFARGLFRDDPDFLFQRFDLYVRLEIAGGKTAQYAAASFFAENRAMIKDEFWHFLMRYYDLLEFDSVTTHSDEPVIGLASVIRNETDYNRVLAELRPHGQIVAIVVPYLEEEYRMPHWLIYAKKEGILVLTALDLKSAGLSLEELDRPAGEELEGIVDARKGTLVINPDLETRLTMQRLGRVYEKLKQFYLSRTRKQSVFRGKIAGFSADEADLEAIRSFEEQIETALARSGAGGIGLLRLEELLIAQPERSGIEMDRERIQAALSEMIASAFYAEPTLYGYPKPFTVRLFDVATDKRPLFLLEGARQPGGWDLDEIMRTMTGARFYLSKDPKYRKFREFGKMQLKAIFAASLSGRETHARVEILFSDVRTAEEIDAIEELRKEAVREFMDELRGAKRRGASAETKKFFNNEMLADDPVIQQALIESIPLGYMIETTGAVDQELDRIHDKILQLQDQEVRKGAMTPRFIGIGSNDLSRSIAVNRPDGKIPLNQLNPYLVRDVWKIAKTFHNSQIPVNLEGEWGGSPLMLFALYAMREMDEGIQVHQVAATAQIPELLEMVRALRLEDMSEPLPAARGTVPDRSLMDLLRLIQAPDFRLSEFPLQEWTRVLTRLNRLLEDRITGSEDFNFFEQQIEDGVPEDQVKLEPPAEPGLVESEKSANGNVRETRYYTMGAYAFHMWPDTGIERWLESHPQLQAVWNTPRLKNLKFGSAENRTRAGVLRNQPISLTAEGPAAEVTAFFDFIEKFKESDGLTTTFRPSQERSELRAGGSPELGWSQLERAQSDLRAGLEDPATRAQTLRKIWNDFLTNPDELPRVAAYHVLNDFFIVPDLFTGLISAQERETSGRVLLSGYFDPSRNVRMPLANNNANEELYGPIPDQALVDLLDQADNYPFLGVDENGELKKLEGVEGSKLRPSKKFNPALRAYFAKEAGLFTLYRRAANASTGTPAFIQSLVSTAQPELDRALASKDPVILESSSSPFIRALSAVFFEYLRQEYVENGERSATRLLGENNFGIETRWRLAMMKDMLGTRNKLLIRDLGRFYLDFISRNESKLGPETRGIPRAKLVTRSEVRLAPLTAEFFARILDLRFFILPRSWQEMYGRPRLESEFLRFYGQEKMSSVWAPFTEEQRKQLSGALGIGGRANHANVLIVDRVSGVERGLLSILGETESGVHVILAGATAQDREIVKELNRELAALKRPEIRLAQDADEAARIAFEVTRGNPSMRAYLDPSEIGKWGEALRKQKAEVILMTPRMYENLTNGFAAAAARMAAFFAISKRISSAA